MTGTSTSHPRGRFRLGHRLGLGFGAVGLALGAAVATTLVMMADISDKSGQMTGLRMPAALAGAQLDSRIYGTLASLRGWILTGDPTLRDERATNWRELAAARAEMDALAQRFVTERDREAWREAKAVMDEFHAAQDRIEALAHTPAAQPALTLLANEAAPRVDAMAAALTRMIDTEQDQPATAERKSLLKTMADVRGSLGLAAASLRAYLLSGDDQFKQKFAELWSLTENRRQELRSKRAVLTADQADALAAFETAAEAFQPLPAKLFEIRGSDKWNMPAYLLLTEAAPRAGRLLDLLEGPRGADGKRAGGLIDRQKQHLIDNGAGISAAIAFLNALEWTLLAVGLAAALAIGLLTGRAIVRPLKGMTAAMTVLAGGDTSIAVPARERRDEIGEMAAAVQVFKDNAVEMARLRAEQEEMRAKAEEERRRAMHQMADNLDASVKQIVDAVGAAAAEMQATAESMAANADQTSKQSSAVAAASQQAAANVQTVAAATEELTSSIGEIGRQVGHSADISRKAVSEAERTNQLVEGLSTAAQRIGEVVNLISDIASQTNLLALNATIEAARAGEAGKGFAVVASEVKSLASQTSRATEEIGGHVAAIQQATQGAVAAIRDIGGTIGGINEVASTIAAAVQQQGAATDEIARNVQEAARGTQDVDSNITGVAHAANETGAAASQVLASAGDLSQLAHKLRNEVDNFVQAVRAA